MNPSKQRHIAYECRWLDTILPQRHLRLFLRVRKTAIAYQQHIRIVPMTRSSPFCQKPAIASPVLDNLCKALPLQLQHSYQQKDQDTGRGLIRSLTPQSMSSQFRQLLHPAAIIAAHGFPLSFPPR